MFLRPRSKTAIAAAAGLSAVSAVSAADQPTPAEGAAASPGSLAARAGLATRLSEAVARIARRAEAGDRAQRRRGGYTIVRVRHGARIKLRAKPGGRTVARVGSRTEFGSPQTLTVADRRGRWLGVTTSERPNGRVAWVDRRTPGLQERRTRVSLHLDLSRRVLELRNGRTRRSVSVGVGASGSPTPTGRFAITDKLRGSAYGGVYGCCILALSGKQERLPPGWKGGDRLAIHGTSGRAGSFTGSSAGCVRADRRTLRLLMREVPLGTPVFVSR
jgi:lipoprotein-anchoring transpeptidase ErfK/SrfK